MTSTVRGRVRRRTPAVQQEPEQRPSRRRRRSPAHHPPSASPFVRRRWIAVAVLAAVTGITYAVLFTSLFGVRSVDVAGARTIPADAVRAAAAIEPGTPLVRLDVEAVHDRVAALPKVFSVEVSRSFPSTVEIVIVERGPVAVVPSGDGVHLVDATGLDYEVVRQNPGGLPELAVSTVHPEDPATRAAVTVLGVIPQQLRAQLVTVSARTAGSVELTLADGRTVRWGSADQSDRKAAVLAPLLTRPGTVYDVTTPDFPTVS